MADHFFFFLKSIFGTTHVSQSSGLHPVVWCMNLQSPTSRQIVIEIFLLDIHSPCLVWFFFLRSAVSFKWRISLRAVFLAVQKYNDSTLPVERRLFFHELATGHIVAVEILERILISVFALQNEVIRVLAVFVFCPTVALWLKTLEPQRGFLR